MPNMKHRLFTPGHVVSLGRIAELREISTGPEEVTLGAGVTLADLSSHPEVRQSLPSLAVAAGEQLLLQANRKEARLFNGQVVTVKSVS